ncbi:hypothetical protein Hanom_Chr10g00908271 [Helianthus anomalus]
MVTPPAQKATAIQPIGKHGWLQSLYKFSPEALKKVAEKVKGPKLEKAKEPEPMKTKFVIIHPKTTAEKEAEKRVEEPAGDVIPEKETLKETETAATTTHYKAHGPEVVHITGLAQPLKSKGLEVVKPAVAAQHDTPTQIAQVISGTRGSAAHVQAQVAHKDASATAAGAATGGSGVASQKGDGKRIPRPRSPIGMEDTLGDIYYKTYTEEQPCRDWFLGTFPPGEVNRQRARNYEGLYHAYIIGEANARAANHQIGHEWRTMYKERAGWEKYRERLLKEAQDFEQMKNKFLEEMASFEKEKKSEEWGRDGLKAKRHAAEELLAKERAEFKKACDNDNKCMYAARTKITNLEAEVANLKGKVEEAQADRERIEVEFSARMVNKDKDLAAKDVEIAELKHRLFEAYEKSESLEIDLEAERVKAETAEEARRAVEEALNINTSALNVAQNNYSEAQSIVDTLVADSEWMRC